MQWPPQDQPKLVLAMTFRIATWNLCLGLANKKDLVLDELNSNKIDVCCMQETELNNDFPTGILCCPLYKFEGEKSTGKKRAGLYVNNRVIYKRRDDLEEENMHLIIIDVDLVNTIRIISLYRSFRPPDGSTPIDFFKKQISILQRCMTSKTIILGDFNLDARMQHRLDYPHKLIYNVLDNFTSNFNLEQIVNFSTWSRSSKNVKKRINPRSCVCKCQSSNLKLFKF